MRKIDKLIIADEMLDASIDEFLINERYFAALNLAGVAQEIYGKWLRANREIDLRSQLLDQCEKIVRSEGAEKFDRKKTNKQDNHIKNSIKHLNSKNDRYLDVDIELESFILIMEAVANHKQLNRVVTSNIERFITHARKKMTN